MATTTGGEFDDRTHVLDDAKEVIEDMRKSAAKATTGSETFPIRRIVMLLLPTLALASTVQEGAWLTMVGLCALVLLALDLGVSRGRT